MSKFSISVVSYLNARIFVKGLQKYSFSTHPSIHLDIPSICAEKLRDGRVDIGLIPLAALPSIPNGKIISDYCIAAEGKVNSVFVFSNTAIDKIHTIYLDPHSNTSNRLTKILCKAFWKVVVKFEKRDADIVPLKEGEGMVLIGDRCFDVMEEYSHRYDLAEDWHKAFNLPFVFAVWVANKEIPKQVLTEFNEALALGYSQLSNVIKEHEHVHPLIHDYLSKNIHYILDEPKRQAIDLFLNFPL
jgi:chorismate dehydratase